MLQVIAMLGLMKVQVGQGQEEGAATLATEVPCRPLLRTILGLKVMIPSLSLPSCLDSFTVVSFCSSLFSSTIFSTSTALLNLR